jgi:hypothetical protein
MDERDTGVEIFRQPEGKVVIWREKKLPDGKKKLFEQ